MCLKKLFKIKGFQLHFVTDNFNVPIQFLENIGVHMVIPSR